MKPPKPSVFKIAIHPHEGCGEECSRVPVSLPVLRAENFWAITLSKNTKNSHPQGWERCRALADLGEELKSFGEVGTNQVRVEIVLRVS